MHSESAFHVGAPPLGAARAAVTLRASADGTSSRLTVTPGGHTVSATIASFSIARSSSVNRSRTSAHTSSTIARRPRRRRLMRCPLSLEARPRPHAAQQRDVDDQLLPAPLAPCRVGPPGPAELVLDRRRGVLAGAPRARRPRLASVPTPPHAPPLRRRGAGVEGTRRRSACRR